jgi:putative two-component system response regulator
MSFFHSDNPSLKKAHIFIVDDDPTNVRLLERILMNSGYCQLTCITDSTQVLELCRTHSPDLILLDLMMPNLSGYEVMEQLWALPGSDFLPVLVLTADSNPTARDKALSGGAKDFVVKPFDQIEVLLRVKNLLETRYLHLQQRDQNQLLENKVRERTHDLEKSQTEMLQRLAQAADFRDDDTGQHTRRVGELCALLAQEIGLDEDFVTLIRQAAPLHDVGKIGIADAILLKPGRLTPEEFAVMKTHAAIGAAILKDGQSALVQVAELLALHHHERWDGSGYPQGLKGEEISIEGRILAVVDVFDALTHERPYKKAWSVQDALAEIERGAGHHFDPLVVETFLRLPYIASLQEGAS